MLNDERIRRALRNFTVASTEVVAALEAKAKAESKSLYRVALESDEVDGEQLVSHLAADLGVPSVSLSGFSAKPELLELVPADVVRRLRALPVGLKPVDGVNTLFVAVEDPLDVEALETLSLRVPYSVVPLLAGPRDLDEAIKRCLAQPAPPLMHDDLFRDVLDNLEEQTQSDMLSALSLLDDIPRNRHEVPTSPSGFQSMVSTGEGEEAVEEYPAERVEETAGPRVGARHDDGQAVVGMVQAPCGVDLGGELDGRKDEAERTGLGKPAAQTDRAAFQRVMPHSVAHDRWEQVPAQVFARALAHALVDAGVLTASALDATIRKLTSQKP